LLVWSPFSTNPVPIDAGSLVTIGITETNYTDCGNVNNRYYAVTAVNENGESDPSNEDRASESCGSAAALTLPVLNAAALTENGGDPVVTKYIFFKGKRVAMDRDGVLQWLVGDHLGTTSLVLKADGTVHSEARHYPYGEERWSSGTLPTDYRFTGQRSESGLGLIHMGARFYDPALGRWISADTIIPDPASPQSLNRYAYVRNSVLNFIDPSGHAECVDDDCSWIIHPVSKKIRQRSPTKSPPRAGVYDPAESYAQASNLLDEFRSDAGPFERSFGPEDSLTQDIIHSSGIQEFYAEWAQAGYLLPWEWRHQIDVRGDECNLVNVIKSLPVYLSAQVYFLVTSVGLGSQAVEGPIDAVDGIIGSLDVIRVSRVSADWVLIEVQNEMNWYSGLRVPGCDSSLATIRISIIDSDVGAVVADVAGGQYPTIQTFYWWAEMPD
jgi:RHS repeat-associated protein